MELVKVDSSMLHSVGYDPKTKELEVVFNTGGIYRYQGVPPKVYKELLAAESKGRYIPQQRKISNHVVIVETTRRVVSTCRCRQTVRDGEFLI